MRMRTYVGQHASDKLAPGDRERQIHDRRPASSLKKVNGHEYATLWKYDNLPLCWLAHALDDFVQRLLTALLQGLRNRLHALLVRCVFKKTRQEMV